MSSHLPVDEHYSLDPRASATPTLQDEPIDVPSREKNPKNSNPEAGPDDDVEDEPHADPAREVVDENDENVLIVDWDGPDDPQNPKKYVFSFMIRLHTRG